MILFLDKDEQVLRIQRSVQIKSLDHEQTLGDQYVSNTLHGEIGLMDEETLNKIEYIAISSPDQPYKFQYFWLKDHKVDKNILSFTGVDSGIEELSKTPIYDRRFKEYPAVNIANELLNGTNWVTGTVAEGPRIQVQFYYMSVFDALKKLCEKANLEMQFFVETTATGIGARYIDFKKKLGDNQGSRVVYGQNGIEITKEIERANLYTALIGRGKGEEVSSAEENAEKAGIDVDDAQAGYGRKINFGEITWSKANGDPLDKPEGQQFLEDPKATAQYGYKGVDGKMHPKIGFIDFDEEEDRELLLQRTYEALKDSARPQVAFKTSATYLKGNIGDIVRVIRPDQSWDYETRIFHIIWDRRIEDYPRAATIEFGDQSVNQSTTGRISSAVSSSVDEQIGNSYGRLRREMNDRLLKVDNFDGSTNYYTPEDPRENDHVPRLNDLWFKPDPDHEGETILYIWNGETWEELIRSADTDLIKKTIDNEIVPYWEEVEAKQQARDDQQEKALDDFNNYLNALSQGIVPTINDQLNKYDEKITKQVNDEIEQTKRYLQSSMEGFVTPEELDEAIAQVKSDTLSSDELRASVNQAIDNAKADLLTPDEARGMIQDALEGLELSQDEVNRILDQYDGFVRVEDFKRQQQDVEDTWRKATQGKELSETTISMLGQPEHIDYGRNLIKGETTQASRDGTVTLESQKPLEADKRYTLSFQWACLLPQRADLGLTFSDHTNIEIAHGNDPYGNLTLSFDESKNVTHSNASVPTGNVTITVEHGTVDTPPKPEPEPEKANLSLSFDDNKNVTHNNAELPKGDVTIKINHS